MKKTYFICDGHNVLATEAIKSTLSKLPVNDFYFTPVLCEESRKLQTISINDGFEQLGKTIDLTFGSFKELTSNSNVYALDVKETVVFSRSDTNPKLNCVAAIMNNDMSKMGTAFSSIELPEQLQQHLVSGKDIYEAVNLSFEEKVTEQTCLYTYFTKKEKLQWYEETIFKLLLF